MKKFVIAIAVVIMAAFAVPAFAAMNPFMDVPASHWAYDAVAQLASRGVISGYPDGAYKGAQPMTRYEMASALARALANVDMEKASKQDVEMLKKLIVEFKDELDALGVKVDKLDERVAVLESDIGGWSIAGQLRFDANFGGDSDRSLYGARGENDFELNRFRLILRKRINETTSFMARLGAAGQDADQTDKAMRWELYSITTKLGYDISLTLGRIQPDWEGQLGLYADNDAWFGDVRYDGFHFKKDWGMANLEFIVGREEGGYRFGKNSGVRYVPDPVIDYELEQFMVAGLANFNITEKFRAGLMAYYWFTDDEDGAAGAVAPIPALPYPGFPEIPGKAAHDGTDTDLLVAGVYMGYAFTPAVELKGLYYYQDQGRSWQYVGPNNETEDTANAWKIMLDVDQEALKFTSLWLEYGHVDNNFARMTGQSYGNFGSTGANGSDLWANRPFNNNTTKVYGISAGQQWNDKWRTFIRYFAADYDTQGVDDATNWSLGFAYRLNPAVEFELAYDKIDFGSVNGANAGGKGYTGDDHMIRFRTFVTF